MRKLQFRANGHLFTVANGTLVTVFTPYLDEPGDPFITELISARCGFCDQRADDLDITLTAATVRNPCPYPDGLTSIITLAVPSGKIIVADDLRPAYNWNDDELANYNSALGQHQAIEAMAKEGCAYGPVGNSCPGLYRTGPDTYVIASLAYDEESDQEKLPASWESLAGIITDLWAYSIADFKDWQERGGDNTGGWYSVVDITPGSYQFTHHTGERSFDRDAEGPVIYAHVQLLKDTP